MNARKFLGFGRDKSVHNLSPARIGHENLYYKLKLWQNIAILAAHISQNTDFEKVIFAIFTKITDFDPLNFNLPKIADFALKIDDYFASKRF